MTRTERRADVARGWQQEATKPVDFRKGMDGLAALVQEQLKADPFICGC